MLKLEELDHERLRRACAEEALAHRAAQDATKAREDMQTLITQKYGLCPRDSLDVQTGVITKAAPPLTLVPEEKDAAP